MTQKPYKIHLHDDNRLLTLWGLKNGENDDEVFVLCSLGERAIKKEVGKNQLAVGLNKRHEYKRSATDKNRNDTISTGKLAELIEQ